MFKGQMMFNKYGSRISYIAFCEECDHPTKITMTVIEEYYIRKKIDYYFCKHCDHKNVFPEYLIKIFPLLL